MPRQFLVVGLLCLCAIAVGQQSELPLAVGTPASQSATPFPEIVVSSRTKIELRLLETVSSAHALAGQKVRMEVVRNLVVDGLVVIPRHTPAVGTILSSKHKGFAGKNGRLELGVESVQLVGDRVVPLATVPISIGGGHGSVWSNMGKAASATAGDNTGIVSVPVFLTAPLWRGKDVEFPAGLHLIAETQQEIVLARAVLLANQPVPAPAKSAATVVIYRLDDHRSQKPSIYCGRVELARMVRGSSLQIELPPGEYFFRSSDKQPEAVLAYAGKTYYLRVGMGPWFSAHGMLVPEEVAEDELLGTKDISIPAQQRVTAATPEDLLWRP